MEVPLLVEVPPITFMLVPEFVVDSEAMLLVVDPVFSAFVVDPVAMLLVVDPASTLTVGNLVLRFCVS